MSDTAHKYLIFSLSGRRYAFDLAQVAEVVERPATCPIPLAPPYYHGAMNFHGTIVAVMDLAAFLGLPSGHDVEQSIVLDARIAALAFSVEAIIRITPQDQAELSGEPGAEPFTVGQLNLPDGRAILLDATAMAQKAAETINN